MKRTKLIAISLLVFLGFTGNLFAQKKEFEKRIYVNTEQNVYAPTNFPLFFSISTDVSGNTNYLTLNPSTEPLKQRPIFFRKEGWIRLPILLAPFDSISNPKRLGANKFAFDLRIDGTSPQIQFSIGKDIPTFKIKDKLYIGKGAALNLQASDNISGVQELLYSLNSDVFTIFSSQINLDLEQNLCFKYYAADNVGNTSVLSSYTGIVDLSAPNTTLKFQGEIFDSIISARTTIELISNDNLSGVKNIKYAFDEGEFKIYQNNLNVAQLMEGDHTIAIFAIDNVSNIEQVKIYKFYLDKTAPIIVDEIQGDSYLVNGKEYSSGRSKLKLTAIDNKAGLKGIYYSLNGAAYQLYEKPFYLNNHKGNIKLKTYALDNVGNRSEMNSGANKSNSVRSYVDIVGPDLAFDIVGPKLKWNDTLIIGSKSTIKLKALDKESGINKIVYNLDGGQDTTYTTPFSTPTSGKHTISYTAYDNVSNSNQSSISYQTDLQGPEIQVVYSAPNYEMDASQVFVYHDYIQLFLTAYDSQVGVKNLMFQLDNLPLSSYHGSLSFQNKQGKHRLKIIALDRLENETVQNIEFIIKN